MDAARFEIDAKCLFDLRKPFRKKRFLQQRFPPGQTEDRPRRPGKDESTAEGSKPFGRDPGRHFLKKGEGCRGCLGTALRKTGALARVAVPTGDVATDEPDKYLSLSDPGSFALDRGKDL
jgi:hypothetical protein